MLVCVSLHNPARETAGAARTRLSLRPLYRGRNDWHTPGETRRGIAKLYLGCLTIEYSCVVPANAGTHNPRRSLQRSTAQQGFLHHPKHWRHGVWVPAFAGTTSKDVVVLFDLRKLAVPHPRQPGGNEFCLHSANHKAAAYWRACRMRVCHVAFQDSGFGRSAADGRLLRARRVVAGTEALHRDRRVLGADRLGALSLI